MATDFRSPRGGKVTAGFSSSSSQARWAPLRAAQAQRQGWEGWCCQKAGQLGSLLVTPSRASP